MRLNDEVGMKERQLLPNFTEKIAALTFNLQTMVAKSQVLGVSVIEFIFLFLA